MATPAPRSSSPRPTQAGARTTTRLRRSILTSTLAALASVAVLFVGMTPALAEPSVAEIESQIDKHWRELEPLIEKHNATREDLAKKKKQAKALQEKIAPLEKKIDEAMDRVSEFAVEAYKGDRASMMNAVLSNKTPSTLIGQLSVLDQFARREQREVQAVIDLKNKYAEQKAPLDALVAELTKTEAEQAKKKKQIDSEIDKLQRMRIEAYGKGAGGPLRPAPCPATYPGGGAGKAVNFACAQIGKPYVWGSEGPNSYDCSGLTLRAWAQAGVSLPHNAARQYSITKRITRSQLQPGDLVFYYSPISHVGMYVGDGWIVHAATAGQPVKMSKLAGPGAIAGFGRPRY